MVFVCGRCWLSNLDDLFWFVVIYDDVDMKVIFPTRNVWSVRLVREKVWLESIEESMVCGMVWKQIWILPFMTGVTRCFKSL